MSKVIYPTAENFDSEISEGLVIVDYFAKWCHPCRMIAPILDELSEDFEGKIKICKIDTDENQELAMKYGIRSLPTLLFFKDGEVIDQMIGSASKEIFAEKINSLL